MPDIEQISGEIERMRTQVHRQRGEIKQLQRAGIPTASAEVLLDRMLDTTHRLCAERDTSTSKPSLSPSINTRSLRWATASSS
jgi:hypothetical protein